MRVHPIITRGGDAVSAVPADVRMETFVRGKSVEAVRRWDRRVDRALRAGAMAVGARVRITTIPGYLPLNSDRDLTALFRSNAVFLVGQKHINPGEHLTGSTDMGDISHIMPAIHPYAMGATGAAHGADYVIEDYDLAVINPAKVMAMTVIDLLAGGAAGARELKARAKPSMTRDAYLKLMRGFAREQEWEE